jgi:ABC-type bacteriocin/lantibiotic exporter with double-glycine peptidase domain
MPTNDEQFRHIGNGPRFRAPASGLLGKILTTVASAAVLVVAFMLSLVVFVTVAAIALLVGGYLWWKTRAVRRQMRERQPGGRVIDGEVMRDVESQETIQR